MQITYLDPSTLLPYSKNNKIHDEEQVERIANSIKEFGFIQPLVVDKENNVIIGHGRLLASKILELTEVPVVKLENLTESQIKKLRILDNKLNESNWNIENLKLELSDLDFDLSIGDLNLSAEMLFPDLKLFDEEETEIEEDDIPEVNKKVTVEYGDIFQLGTHRLSCGDSTKKEDVDKLMNGELADLLQTDPPYNVDYEGGNGKKIMNDKMGTDAFYEFLNSAFSNASESMKDGAGFYVRHASREVINFETALTDAGLSVRQQLIWNKNSLVLGRQDYQWKHEPCLYGWKDTGTHKWYGGRAEATIIDRDKPLKSAEHPTMKPVGLIDYQIKNSSKKDDLVLDLFGGSGTTLIACEQNGRRCYMMELDPKYVEVVIRRYHNLSPDGEIKCLNRDVDISQILDS